MGKLNERISQLEQRLRELRAQEARRAARQRTEVSRRERARETRRKILLGAWVLSQIDRGKLSRESVWSSLQAYLTRPEDRALFDGSSDGDRVEPNSDAMGKVAEAGAGVRPA